MFILSIMIIESGVRKEEPRILGLAMVPGRHIVSIHVDQDRIWDWLVLAKYGETCDRIGVTQTVNWTNSIVTGFGIDQEKLIML